MQPRPWQAECGIGKLAVRGASVPGLQARFLIQHRLAFGRARLPAHNGDARNPIPGCPLQRSMHALQRHACTTDKTGQLCSASHGGPLVSLASSCAAWHGPGGAERQGGQLPAAAAQTAAARSVGAAFGLPHSCWSPPGLPPGQGSGPGTPAPASCFNTFSFSQPFTAGGQLDL